MVGLICVSNFLISHSFLEDILCALTVFFLAETQEVILPTTGGYQCQEDFHFLSETNAEWIGSRAEG